MQEGNIEEIFCGMPKMLALFREWERELVRAELGIHKKGAPPEKISARNEVLLQTAQSITEAELKLLYYLRCTDGMSADKVLKEIRKVFRAQCALKNSLCGADLYTDIL
ncbi:MAG: hypothetical protein IJ284_03310 [Clostridia bacterium]|nr:hypothetical protein [Clostridia bacterium]